MTRVDARQALLRGLKATAWVADRIRPPQRGVVVLLYHRVGGGSRLELDLPTELFIRQLEVLAHANVIDLSEALGLLASGNQDLNGRSPTVVTFDDGTADFVDTVLPLLVRDRIPATLYLATRFLEERRRFPRGAVPLTWTAVGEALSTGLVTIGSHTHSHLLLDRVTAIAAETELRRSIDLIGERLGVAARHFAYPKAVLPTQSVEVIVRRLFDSAAVGGNHPNVPGRTDLHRLARSPIQASDGMRWFDAKLSGGLELEERLRGTLKRVRYTTPPA